MPKDMLSDASVNLVLFVNFTLVQSYSILPEVEAKRQLNDGSMSKVVKKCTKWILDSLILLLLTMQLVWVTAYCHRLIIVVSVAWMYKQNSLYSLVGIKFSCTAKTWVSVLPWCTVWKQE